MARPVDSADERLPTPFSFEAIGPWRALVFTILVPAIGSLVANAHLAANAEPSASPVESIPAPRLLSDPLDRQFRYVGTASCAASNCHGGDGTRPPRPGGDTLSPQAYSIWIQRDAHANAYSTLLNEKSRQMAEKLGLTDAHSAKVCLECHAVSDSSADLVATHRHTIHDGVSCESCHGGAEEWLEPHKWSPWSALSSDKKEQLGFRDMDRLAARAVACAKCHIGDGQRDVTHRIIAAGHPRLSFELSAYHANMPKHWRNESIPQAMLDANLWVVGQVISASTSLQLLSHRADNPDAAWPDFAEYSCFACHHDLADPSWRQREYNATRPRSAGSLVWGSWHYRLLSVAADQGWTELQRPLAELREEMSYPYPDRNRVQELSANLQDQLQQLADVKTGRAFGADQLASYLQRLTSADDATSGGDWDCGAQQFLAVASLYHSAAASYRDRGQSVPQRWREIGNQLRVIRRNLLFYEADDSRRFDSPQRMTIDRRQAVIDAFAEIGRLGDER